VASISALRRAERALRLIGRRAFLWLCVGGIASAGMAIVELAITVVIQVFLKILGVLDGPIGFKWLDTHALTAWHLGAMLLVVGAVRSGFQFLVVHSGSVSQDSLNARLRFLSIYEMLKSESGKYVSSATVSYRIGEVFPKASQFTFYAAMLASLGLTSLLLTVLMLSAAWREACVGLSGLVLIGLLIMRINRRVRYEAGLIPGEQHNLVSGIERVARNWLLVQALRTKQREYAVLGGNIAKYTTHSLRANFLSNVATAVTPFFGIVLLVLMLILNRVLWHTAGLAMISCLYMFVRFTQNLGQIASYAGFMNSYLPQFREAVRYFFSLDHAEVMAAMHDASKISMKAPVDERAPAQGGAAEPLPPPSIDARNLTYAYPGQPRPAVSGLSFAVPAGSQCAFTGPSGAGKSTLLALVLGLFEPGDGSIALDGRAPKEFFRDRRTRVGYVGPDPFIIEGTIRDNMTYGCFFAVDEQQCWEALRAANLDQVVAGIPEKLDYKLSANADGLSAGQKQRLALARALLNRPQLLILDEPSANLDDQAETQIAESIQRLKGKTTVLLVSHRRGILRFADRTVEL
jgi:ABC-type multidrug transport system fused ATPase/permease subunit